MTTIDAGSANSEVIGWVDPASYPGIETLAERWEEIRDELQRLIDSRVPWFLVLEGDSVHEPIGMVDDPIPRKFFPLWRERNFFPTAAQLCPRTIRILAALPAAFSGWFASIEAGVEIAPHQGNFDILDRCHLGLVVPPGDVQLRVAGITRPFREGGVMIFNDRVLHEAWNHTSQRRFNLVVDFEKARAVNRAPLAIMQSAAG